MTDASGGTGDRLDSAGDRDYSSIPGSSYIEAEAGAQTDPAIDSGSETEGSETESEVAERVEGIDTQLAGETDPAIRQALLSELGPLLDQIGEATYYRNPRLTNVRNNFALGSYYDAVNIGVNDGKK